MAEPRAPMAAAAAPPAVGSGGSGGSGQGRWDGRVYKLREFPCAVSSGSAKGVDFTQSMGRIRLRHVLGGAAAGLEAKDLTVELSSWELRVRTGNRNAADALLSPLSGDLHADVRRDLSWWTLERGESGDNVFTIELTKRDHRSWNAIWKLGMNHHRKNHFGWGAHQKGPIKKAEDMLVRLKPGRPQPREKDPFVMNREALCAGLEDGQDDNTAVFRIQLDKDALEKVCETICLADLFGADVMQRHFKLFIRGDERSPILMGQLDGDCIPDLTRWEIIKVFQPTEPGKTTAQYVNCLQVTLAKAWDFRRHWPKILYEHEMALEREAAPARLEDLHQQQTIRDASPDKTGWAPEDHARDSKGKGDTCFKRGVWHDAVVHYTRAINHTPDDEKLYSNRSACYNKLNKYEKALTDAKKCLSLKSNWQKGYFRQGQALRGLQRYEDAIHAFKEGRFRDPQNPDWEKEIEKTEEERGRWDAHAKKERRVRREADMTTELNEATSIAERGAMVAVAEQALRAGKTRREAGELAMKGAELAKQRVQEEAVKKAMMVEDDHDPEAPPPYRIVKEDGSIHPKGFTHTDKGTYFMGMVIMNAERPPAVQPWVEIRHPGRLRWSQGCANLRLKVTLPESVTSAAMLDVKVTSNNIIIGTVGDADPIVVGDFERRVDPEGENYSWYLIPDEKPPVLEMSLDKAASEVYQTFSYGTLLWPRLFSDDVQLGEGLFEADLTDLPPHLLEKWRREQARANAQSLHDRNRRNKMTEEEVMEETSRNWNDEFARHGMPQRFDTSEEKMTPNMRY